MARAGETIENPLTGERITFLETTGDTGGESLKFEYTLPPGFSIPEHIHPKQEERHEIVSGTLRGRVAGRERDYAPGQKVIGPAGVPHAWRNPSDDEDLRIISELRPALRFEPLLETYFAISRDLKSDKRNLPGHFMRLAILVDESRNHFHPTGMPMVAWKASMTPFTALARVGGLFGYADAPPGHGDRLLPIVSALWLLNSAFGASIAIRENLPAEFAGMSRWRDPSADFFGGSGTALSPGLPMMAALAVFTALSTRDGKAGAVGVAGMTALGIGATVGVMGEPITYKVFSPHGFDPAKASIVSAAVVLSPLMAMLGARRLFALRDGDPEPVWIERSEVVSRPPEEVFEFVADIRNDPKWVWTLSEARKTSEGPLGVGTTFVTVARLPGRRIETPETVVAYEPNRRLDTEGGVGSLWFAGSRIVEGVAGGSRITVSIELRLNGFLGVVGPILAPLARRQLKAEISILKDVLEGRTPKANDRGRVAKFLAAGLAAAIPFALLRRRNKKRRTS
jgi:quercetin dioxygenase-like cupin family protein